MASINREKKSTPFKFLLMNIFTLSSGFPTLECITRQGRSTSQLGVIWMNDVIHALVPTLHDNRCKECFWQIGNREIGLTTSLKHHPWESQCRLRPSGERQRWRSERRGWRGWCRWGVWWLFDGTWWIWLLGCWVVKGMEDKSEFNQWRKRNGRWGVRRGREWMTSSFWGRELAV